MTEIFVMHVVNTTAIYAIFILTGCCYAGWLAPFVRRKRTAYLTAGVYVALTILLSLLPAGVGESPLKYISVIMPLCLLYLLERWNLRQKIFLCMVFVVLRWLAIGTFAEIGFYERDFIFSFAIFRSSVAAAMTEFIVWQILWATGTVALLALSVRFVLRVYRQRKEELTGQELVMLLAPIGALLTVRPMISEYYDLWGEGIRAGFLQKNIPGNIYRLLFYALSFAAILVLISFYQQIRSRQKEEEELRVLERQIADNKKHLEQVEGFFTDMRALKHDMGNHIATLEHLIRQGNNGEASAYVEALGAEFAEIQPRIRTGNPVTDVILSEYAGIYEKQGISFTSHFIFPADTKVNAFDLSILLNNALQNALEAAVPDMDFTVRISSVRKNNLYIIDVRNPLKEEIPMEETGMPETAGKRPGHGYGLRNIRNVALRYQGDMDIRQERDAGGQLWFILNIMLLVGE